MHGERGARAGPDEADDVLDARLYDLIHRGNPGDVAFYLDRCRGAATALEIGCGTGRILAALVDAGIEVVGVEVDRARAAAARARIALAPRPAVARVVEADVRGLDLGRRFDRVLAPYSVLHALLRDDDLERALAAVRRHLAEGGRVVLDGYRLDADALTDCGEDAPAAPLVTIRDGDETVRVFERDRVGPEPGRVDVEYTFHLHRPGVGVRVRTQTVRHRVRTPEALSGALDRAGLEVVEGPTSRGAWFTMVAAVRRGTAPHPS